MMQLFKTKKEIRSYLDSLRPGSTDIGLVPTMGALHRGHLALVERAKAENGLVVVSIFVNPTQFNNDDDLEKYPKTLERDLELLQQANGKLLVFAPPVSEMYHEGVNSRTYNFDGLEQVMEGLYRPGHFNGVGTIVEELLRLIKPARAYFGEKDFQQLQIIRKLVASGNIPVEIIGCPIVRESGGLALSSRNERLPERLRKEASFIYRTLEAARSKFGTKSAHYVLNWVRKQFREHPNLELEYVEITDENTLTPVIRKKKDRKYRAFIAAYASGVRLIDNIALN
jgi:pantoate--beta-alanine ligase